ncbi:endonuclease/exonuclease/phosphatase (EEP) superfamily protein YafD [Haloactinopolyspora alba]|uniref:Endonuclease/exonuclease/phosphatase (EEP) superfamily protein YafD n=1 Tax=Haloactinopolyspora alba TaxID=648780 RepID=A0A2P8DXF7_9ACTN|nr:endonuclease/exonuclease/phosphatase family protein [Haloactinopolyspora alba]PSL01909.1 endonuclease/exonuclease/phosphatase (EEP) superfamily protein YafD [Haloactinopolyspora alba]
MTSRVAGCVVAGVLSAVVALAAVWPRALGLADRYGPAQVVAMRGVVVLAGLVLLAALLATARWWRRSRPYVLTLAAVTGVATACSAVILLVRGPADDPLDAAARGDLTVLTFNTLHDGVAPDAIAALIDEHAADVVVLPETSRATTREAARIAGGFQVFHHTVDSITSATGLLVADRLGRYEPLVPHPGGALGSFTVRPRAADGVPITAVHAYPPASGAMQLWRTDTAWAVRACRQARGGIVAGDLNATVDHPALADAEPCVDAAAARDAAATGTWPADLPRWLGAPIDHVLVDARTWRVEAFHVLDARGGSDHRPVVAVLQRRP